MDGSLHTFVICAYKESAYLEECIQSLLHQTVSSNIIMVTSTPNDHIRRYSQVFNIPLYINEGKGGIAQDWNFGYAQCNSAYVTIAHQDDLYFPTYTQKMLERVSDDTLIAFSDYSEIRENQLVNRNNNLKIKKMLLFPLRFGYFQRIKWIRRRILGFGNPICCPSVMYVRRNLTKQLFAANFRSNVDWEAWEKISKRKGKFVYINENLMGHRIHSESETTATILENVRNNEDYEMFVKFWPSFIAKIITRFYALSEESNKIKGKKESRER